MNGHKDVMGMYDESAKFWLSIMNGPKDREIQDGISVR